jgi:CheY-like chemotaxis protein
MARRERRVKRRFPLVLSVQIPPGGSAREWTENLSATGLFVRSERAFTVGERFTLSITFPGVAKDVEIEVQVVRRRGVGAEGPAGVEDNQLVAAMYTSALRRLADKDGFSGLQIEHAADGGEAMARLEREPPIDVVITDVYMPVMSGFVLLEKIRGDEKLRDLPVVVISSGSRREQDDAARLGAQYFLRKPVKYQEIVAVVRTLLTAAAYRATGQP